jgi:hypothetical protein
VFKRDEIAGDLDDPKTHRRCHDVGELGALPELAALVYRHQSNTSLVVV